MNTSLSTGCVESSSSFEMLGASPSSEVFHGTSASDFGESSLPSTDMPDICTSPFGFSVAAAATVLAGFFVPRTAAVRGAAASSATAEPLATSNDMETMSARCMCPPSDSLEGARRIREIQIAENRKVEPREMEVRDERDCLLVTRTRFCETALLAVNHAELVVRNRMAGVELERALETRLRLVEITGAAVRNAEIDVRRGRRRYALYNF